MATITKVELSAVVPTEVRHHRELPAGDYRVVLSGFRENIYLLRRAEDGNFFFIHWLGKGQMLNDFVVHSNGDLEYDDPNDRPSPG